MEAAVPLKVALPLAKCVWEAAMIVKLKWPE
jgi:hypothetical protein